MKKLIKKYNEGKLKEVSETDAILGGVMKYIRIHFPNKDPIYLEELKGGKKHGKDNRKNRNKG